MRGLARGLVLAALFGALLQARSTSSAADPVPTAASVAEVVGRGFWDKALCLGCAAAIIAGGQLTWGGLLMLASLNPDVIAVCAYQCYVAYTL